MKLHANAALSLTQRRRMVLRVLEQGWTIKAAAAAAETSPKTCGKWVSRYRASSESGLLDHSSAPLVWGVAFIGAALLFYYYTTGNDTPAVVLALSIASITYGALLAAYILAGRWSRARGPHLIAAVSITMIVMLMVVFARPLSERAGFQWLEPVSRLAWPWYVPLGTLLAVTIGTVASLVFPGRRLA